jgi:REP element-mobilizing transposase RayT
MSGMTYDRERHHRRSIRMDGFDYSAPGSYFITICTSNRECLLGNVVDGEMRLNRCGEIVSAEWARSARLRPTLRLDAVIVMPNHLHGIVALVEERAVGAHSCAPLPTANPLSRSPRSIASFVAQFKATTARRINAVRGTHGARVWQRNYF